MSGVFEQRKLECIEKARHANATQHGVLYADYRALPTSEIEVYREKIAERKAKAKRDYIDEERGAGKLGGVASRASSINEFIHGGDHGTGRCRSFCSLGLGLVVLEEEAEDDEAGVDGRICYVLVPTGSSLPELQCVTHPDHLCGLNLHTCFLRTRDEDAACATYYVERLEQCKADAGKPITLPRGEAGPCDDYLRESIADSPEFAVAPGANRNILHMLG